MHVVFLLDASLLNLTSSTPNLPHATILLLTILVKQKFTVKIILASLITSIAALAQAKQACTSTAVFGEAHSLDGLGVDPGQLGQLDLLDPLGLAEDTDSFAHRHAVEIKHGYVTMAAFIGMMVQELGIAFPGSLDLAGEVPFSSVLDDGMGLAALANVPALGLAQILLFGGIAETVAMPTGQCTGGPQNLPGGHDRSAGTIPGGCPGQTEDPEARDRALNVEIQNGCGAMLGVTRCMMHSMIDTCDHHFFCPITHAQIRHD